MRRRRNSIPELNFVCILLAFCSAHFLIAVKFFTEFSKAQIVSIAVVIVFESAGSHGISRRAEITLSVFASKKIAFGLCRTRLCVLDKT